ncbi:MAG TPA: hypothetical protein VME92_09540 [Acetobacteraceae bacterium]|nr:hypothetical protein [Acetobacteraceae bacterium]
MRTPRRLAALAALSPLGLAIALGGCSGFSNAFSPGDNVPPASVSGAFDGNYQGRSTLVRAMPNALCPAGGPGVIEIGDGSLTFPYTPDLIFDTAINPDGTWHAEIGTARLDGRIVGNHLAMSVNTPSCQTQYSADYVWNHSS